MYIQKLIPVILSVMLMSACTTSKEEIVITVSGEVISTGYIGNGVEWDPYDEAEAWGLLFRKQTGKNYSTGLILCVWDMCVA